MYGPPEHYDDDDAPAALKRIVALERERQALYSAPYEPWTAETRHNMARIAEIAGILNGHQFGLWKARRAELRGKLKQGSIALAVGADTIANRRTP